MSKANTLRPHIALFVGVTLSAGSIAARYEAPVVDDLELEVILFASDPEIVTPIGAVTNHDGDLFVVESHTHSPASNYPGPKFDRIKRFRDTDKDGRADESIIFADGLTEALDLAFSPDGVLHVVTSKDVFKLADRNGDGVSSTDERSLLLRLETENTNPHGSLLAITIAGDGSIFVTRGNVGGRRFAWNSAAGETIYGYGEGGDIVRIGPDGSGLRVVATGFWNPFAIQFDRFGRLVAADNDPDSRGPNRIVHVIEGGDYGYRARYGPTGLHPFSGWNADLPTVLPIAVGTGEAPSGVLDLTQWNLGDSYRNASAVTIWGEHNVTLYRPETVGTSFQAKGEKWLTGGEFFRPVDLAPTVDGGFYITDWVLSDYPNHSRGAIWRVRPKESAALCDWPQTLSPDPGTERLNTIRYSRDISFLVAAAEDPDPFVRTTASVALAETAGAVELEELWKSENSLHRVVAWQARERTEDPVDPEWVADALDDSSEDIQILALIWIGDRVDRSFESQVDSLLENPEISPRLFRSILATLQILDSNVDELYAAGVRGTQIAREIPPHIIERVVLNSAIPAKNRAFAIPQLSAPLSPEVDAALKRTARERSSPELAREALRTLVATQADGVARLIQNLALDPQVNAQLRADAISLLTQVDQGVSIELLPILDSESPDLRRETARALRFIAGQPSVESALRIAAQTNANDPELASHVNRALGQALSNAPTDLGSWQEALAEGGNAAAGNRVFHEPASMCITCHRIDNRGGRIGPDLSRIGATLSRMQLIRSIVNPSDDVSPEYQGWEIHKTDGSKLIGLQLHLRSDGILLDGLDGATFKTSFTEIESYDSMKKSLMPDGFDTLLSLEDLRNLVAYLESLK